jgi:eukaryotic-like serine/threonine-protein kinase
MTTEPTPPELVEELCAGQRRHWQQGDRVPVETYLRQLPALESNPDFLLELVYNEILLREESEEKPCLEEYVRRFPGLAARLKPLFEVHQALSSDRLLAPGGTDSSADTPAREPDERAPPTGLTLGDYVILRELGRGGMGVVYEARQVSLNRLVALKMILSGELASRADVLRFRAEAEAAADLDHPHIVPIYEVGERAGRHYFSMKLVKGASLAQSLAQGQWAAGGPEAGRRAARMVEAVARAVHYAHQRGILHRDVKPANILLDDQGQPYVTDFGLAKRVGTGERESTPTGGIVGTPSYMAPEQASGRKGGISTACDVYSLGAVLYELLTGRPPFRGETALETLRLVQEQKPQRPRALNPQVSRDLETVCLKCLHQEPAQRYATAKDLADDLHRYLGGEPIRGRPVSRAERLWRWCRRRPLVAGLSGALLLAFGLGLGGVVWQWQRAEGQRRLAESNFRQARRAVDDYFTQVSQNKLLKVPGLQPLRKDLLETALAYYQGFLEERAADAGLQTDVAGAHLRVAQITNAIGSKDDARAHYEKARALYERLAGADPGNGEAQHALAIIYDDLAALLPSTDGGRDEALDLVRRALAIREAIARADPDNIDHQHNLALSRLNTANLLLKADRFAEALDSLEQARGLFGRVAKPGQAYGSWGLAKTHVAMGFANTRLGRYADALRAYEQARALFEGIVQADPYDPAFPSDLAYTCMWLGQLYASGFSQPDQALASYERARALLQKLVRENPAVTEYAQRLALCSIQIGEQHKTGQPSEALRAYEEAGRILDQLAALNQTPEIQDLQAGCATNLGELQTQAGAGAAALASLQQARDVRERLVGLHPDDLECRNNLAVTLHHLGEAQWLLGRREEALACYRQATEQQHQALHLGPQVPQLRQALSTLYRKLAQRQRELGRPGEAAATARRRRDLWPGQPDELYDVARELALCIPLVGKEPTALTAAQQAEREGYAAEAMAELRQAVAHGFRDAERLRKDPDLELLRSRDDFRKLVDDLGRARN